MTLPARLYKALLDAIDEAEGMVGCKDPKDFEAYRQHYAALRAELRAYRPVTKKKGKK